MFRVAPVSDLVPLAGGRTVLVRDVPAATDWTAEIWSAVGIRVEPSKFALLPGGHVALDVFMDSSPIPPDVRRGPPRQGRCRE